MICDLRLTIRRCQREEALIDCGPRVTVCRAEGLGSVNVPSNCAKRLECVVFSDALPMTRCVMTAGALPKAVLKPPQSRRFATSEALLALAPGFRPVNH